MKRESTKIIIKIFVIIISLVTSIGLFTVFLDAALHPDGMGINFICSLTSFPVSVALFVYSIISIINIFKNKIEITVIDKILIALFIALIIQALLFVIMLKVIA